MLRTPPSPAGPLETALDLHRRGLRLIPLRGKRALLKDWPALRLDEDGIRAWGRRGVNWGVLTGEPLVVLDTDTAEAEAWVRQNGIDSPVVVRSGGRGLHRYFRCPEGGEVRSRSAAHGIRGLDVKGRRGYVVAAGSVHPETRRRYAYLPGRELRDIGSLPLFDPAWIRDRRVQPCPRPAVTGGCARGPGGVRNVRAYVRAIPSIEGQGGDRACFRVACLLARAGLGFEEALAELRDWNETNAVPPWPDRELERKLRCAFARVSEER